MKYEHRIKELEERKQEIIRFTTELDEKLRTNQINLIEYQILMNEQYPEKNKEELINEIHEETRRLKNHAKKQRKTKIQLSIAGAILIILAVISLFSQYSPEMPAGFVISTKQITQTIDYNRVFDHYTETQLNLTNITSLRISGVLEGTRATIKLRIN
nr:hypothetical protein [Nanoarchaeota archaeon]